jgi:hypothetical protein
MRSSTSNSERQHAVQKTRRGEERRGIGRDGRGKEEESAKVWSLRMSDGRCEGRRPGGRLLRFLISLRNRGNRGVRVGLGMGMGNDVDDDDAVL